MDKPLRIKGHKLEHSRSGVHDAYARGRCACGWVFQGWTHHRSSVVVSYRQHLEVMKMRAEKAKGEPIAVTKELLCTPMTARDAAAMMFDEGAG